MITAQPADQLPSSNPTLEHCKTFLQVWVIRLRPMTRMTYLGHIFLFSCRLFKTNFGTYYIVYMLYCQL